MNILTAHDVDLEGTKLSEIEDDDGQPFLSFHQVYPPEEGEGEDLEEDIVILDVETVRKSLVLMQTWLDRVGSAQP